MFAVLLMTLAQDPVMDLRSAVKDGVRLLLDRQAGDGSWGTESTFGEDVNIRSAITVFCCRALAACGQGSAQEKEAIERGIQFIAKHAYQRPKAPSYGMYDFSFYSCSYALAYFSGLHRDDLKGSIECCLKTLQENQREDGGFTYLFPGRRDNYESFTTALVIINNVEAQANGAAIPKEMNRRALAALQKARTAEGYFCYHMIDGKQHGSVSGNGKLFLEGSLVRTVVCEYALLKLGEGKPENLARAVENFFKFRKGLEDVRKHDRKTHQGPYDNAPYYFMFGHLYAGRSLKELDKKVRQERNRALEEILLAIREEDGSWLDGRITGKDYGIATALLLLDQVKTTDEY
jgi:hypothetical protein